VIVSVCFVDEKASGIDQLTPVRLEAAVRDGLNCGMLSIDRLVAGACDVVDGVTDGVDEMHVVDGCGRGDEDDQVEVRSGKPLGLTAQGSLRLGTHDQEGTGAPCRPASVDTMRAATCN
jgi:hypothetical protein